MTRTHPTRHFRCLIYIFERCPYYDPNVPHALHSYLPTCLSFSFSWIRVSCGTYTSITTLLTCVHANQCCNATIQVIDALAEVEKLRVPLNARKDLRFGLRRRVKSLDGPYKHSIIYMHTYIYTYNIHDTDSDEQYNFTQYSIITR